MYIYLNHLPVVFLSNGERDASINRARVHDILGPDRVILDVTGIEGVNEAHAVACEVALAAGHQHCIIVEGDNWLLPVAKEELGKSVPINALSIDGWTLPRRIQSFLTYGGVSGWVTSHGGIKVVLCDPSWFRELKIPDFSSLQSKAQYSTLPAVISVERFNTDAWSAFRTGFKEAARALRDRSGVQYKDEQQVQYAGVKWRQNLWMWACVGADQPNGYWCQLGVASALECWLNTNMLDELNWEHFLGKEWRHRVMSKCGLDLDLEPPVKAQVLKLQAFNGATGLGLWPLTAVQSASFKSNYLGLHESMYQ